MLIKDLTLTLTPRVAVEVLTVMNAEITADGLALCFQAEERAYFERWSAHHARRFRRFLQEGLLS